MRLWSDTFRDGGLIPAENAFAAIDPHTHVRLSGNRNPHLAWDEVPHGAESLALFCIDVNAPFDTRNANRADRRIEVEAARYEFFHWCMVDIPLAVAALAEGAYADQVVPRGKLAASVDVPGTDGQLHAVLQGVNDYSSWFAADADMAGQYYGYDGPCPPWNDERIHHYIFRLYALDVARLDVPPRFTGQEARAAIHGHILDEAQWIGAYSLNPALAITLKK